MADVHLSPDDLAGYWAPDPPADAVERIEAHVFACGACAQQLDTARGTIDGILAVASGKPVNVLDVKALAAGAR